MSRRRNRRGRESSARKQTSWRRSLSFVPLEFAVLGEPAIYRLRSEPFSEKLYEEARKNLSTMIPRLGKKKDLRIIESVMSDLHNAESLSQNPPRLLRSLTLKSRNRRRNRRRIFRIYTRFTRSSLKTYLESQRYPTTTPKLLWISKGLLVKD